MPKEKKKGKRYGSKERGYRKSVESVWNRI